MRPADLEKLGGLLAEITLINLTKQFRAQGHELTGAFINSLKANLRVTTKGLVLEFFGNDYGGTVNTGITSNRIPYTIGGPRRGGVSQYIQALIRYAQRRMGLRGKEATGAAFAIARKHKREGMPTRGSYAFSTTGKRTGYIEAALDASSPEVAKAIEQFTATQFQILITNFAKEARA